MTNPRDLATGYVELLKVELQQARDELADLRARVRDLHFADYVEEQVTPSCDGKFCHECCEPYPCSTVAILEGLS